MFYDSGLVVQGQSIRAFLMWLCTLFTASLFIIFWIVIKKREYYIESAILTNQKYPVRLVKHIPVEGQPFSPSSPELFSFNTDSPSFLPSQLLAASLLSRKLGSFNPSVWDFHFAECNVCVAKHAKLPFLIRLSSTLLNMPDLFITLLLMDRLLGLHLLLDCCK